jgi:hypothetical protein
MNRKNTFIAFVFLILFTPALFVTGWALFGTASPDEANALKLATTYSTSAEEFKHLAERYETLPATESNLAQYRNNLNEYQNCVDQATKNTTLCAIFQQQRQHFQKFFTIPALTLAAVTFFLGLLLFITAKD